MRTQKRQKERERRRETEKKRYEQTESQRLTRAKRGREAGRVWGRREGGGGERERRRAQDADSKRIFENLKEKDHVEVFAD